MNERLNIKNFGPITEASIDFDKYTFLVGSQGSGKSSIVKLYALFTWMEKGLARRILSQKHITSFSRFRKVYCKYHKIDEYFRNDTYIDFTGRHYSFLYKEGNLTINTLESNDDYSIAKVMYVPAERNFLSVIENFSQFKNFPESLQSFLEEFENAKKEFRKGYKFPFGEEKFEYDALNKLSWISGSNHKIRLSSASSGYQSVLPLLIVSKYLSNLVSKDSSSDKLGILEKQQIKKEIESIMQDNTLSDEVKYSMARSISARFSYSHFVNIVEEPEQNLYPESQKSVLYELLSHANSLEDNRLILTTHSPYLLNYVTIAVKAWNIAKELPKYQEEINKIVSFSSQINPSKLKIYEVNKGKVKELETYNGIPSDNNFLNNHLEQTNILYNKLLEIEEDGDYEAES